MNPLNLEPIRQRLGEYRFYNGRMEVGKTFGVTVVDARRKMLDDLDDLIREVDRLRAENVRNGDDINLMADEIERLGKENIELKCRGISPVSP